MFPTVRLARPVSVTCEKIFGLMSHVRLLVTDVSLNLSAFNFNVDCILPRADVILHVDLDSGSF